MGCFFLPYILKEYSRLVLSITPVSNNLDVWTCELTLLWEFALWVTRQRCTMVPALSSRGQSSALGKSHLNTFSLVPELNLLHRQDIHRQSLATISKYHLVHVLRSVPAQILNLLSGLIIGQMWPIHIKYSFHFSKWCVKLPLIILFFLHAL